MSAKPMTLEELASVRGTYERHPPDLTDYDSIDTLLCRLLATLDAAERRAEAAEADADGLAAAFLSHLDGCPIQTDADDAALSSHAAAVEGREKVPSGTQGARPSDDLRKPGTSEGAAPPRGTDPAAAAVAVGMLEGFVQGVALFRLEAVSDDRAQLVGIVTAARETHAAYRAARGGGKGGA